MVATPVLCVVGTRPEAIKMAPVIRALRNTAALTPITVSTNQHPGTVQSFLAEFEVTPDVVLDVPDRRSSDLSELLAALLPRLGAAIQAARPGAVLVQGDTSSALAGALAAFYAKVPVGHVEAGLRSGRADDPFPEEMHRRMVGECTTWHFAPTTRAVAALTEEGVPAARIFLTGNTVVDALRWITAEAAAPAQPASTGRRRLLVTAHRRENWDEPMRRIGRALARLAERDDLEVRLSLHPNPAVRGVFAALLADCPRVTMFEPLGYRDFAGELAQASVILTDSGGLQEEGPALGRPVLVMRETTERPEAVDAGVARLIGTDEDTIVAQVTRLLDDPTAYAEMSHAISPFGDGHAARRIASVLTEALAPVASGAAS